MGKLRHRVLEPPVPAAWRAAVTSDPPDQSLTPTIPIPAVHVNAAVPPPSQGTSDVNPNSPGQPWRNKNKAINHPCFTPAPVCSLSRVALCGAGGTPHQSGNQTGSALPTSCLSALPARALPAPTACGQAAKLGCKTAPCSGYDGGCPRPRRCRKHQRQEQADAALRPGSCSSIPGASLSVGKRRRRTSQSHPELLL